MEVPVEEGVLIVEAAPGSPAVRAGLRGGQQQVRVGRYSVCRSAVTFSPAIDGEPIAIGPRSDSLSGHETESRPDDPGHDLA